MTRTVDPAGWPEADCRTPEHIVERLLDYLHAHHQIASGATLVDLGCGTGAIADVLARVYGPGNVTGVDVRPPPGGQAWAHIQADALVWRPQEPVDLVVSNPPFTLVGFTRGRYNPDFDGVARFTDAALEMARVGVCILHRTGWWSEGQDQRVAWREELRSRYSTAQLAVGRANFLNTPGKSGDATPYSWLVVMKTAPRPTIQLDWSPAWRARRVDGGSA